MPITLRNDQITGGVMANDEPRESWLARNSRAENGQIWSIVLMPIWLPITVAIWAYCWAISQYRRASRQSRDAASEQQKPPHPEGHGGINAAR